MSAPLKKNDEITLEITGMTNEGAGVGRYDGFAVFVPGALPKETVKVHIIKKSSSYAVGKLCEVCERSAFRAEPFCPVFPKCGGCTLQHMSYEAQLDYKRGAVRDALERIGGFKGIEVKPVIGMEDPKRYRNKGSYPFALNEGRVAWGLYASRSHRLIETADCGIECEETVLAAKAVADWANANSVQAYDEANCTGVLRHVVVRRCTGGTAVCVVTSGRLPNKEDLIDRIKRAVPNVVSIVHNINSKDTNVICGAEYKLIWGENTVKESICGLEFDVSAESFLQVNRVQTEKLYRLAVDGLELTGEENVADVFCGIGTISLMLANRARSVVGIEYVEKAVEDAKRNAELNGLDNAEFFSGSAERLLPRLVADGRSFDCITLDPPRKGADPAVLEAILKSGANRIAYVSCDPATLARDLKILCAGGFEILSVQPVDMFPFTHHIETVVHLRRNIATHQMNLDPAPFEMIENGSKTIELRLFDEKRRKIKPGDAIVFTNTDTGEKLSATVLNLHCFRSFEELYQTLPLMKCGYSKEKVAQAKPSDMEQYYSEELQKRYGVVGIELCLHEKNDEKV